MLFDFNGHYSCDSKLPIYFFIDKQQPPMLREVCFHGGIYSSKLQQTLGY